MRFLGALMLLSGVVTIRLTLISRFYPVLLESDEAIVGLMARHILDGDLPIFYYGQHYLGALEAYFASCTFALLGPTALTLKLTTLFLFLVFLAVHFRLAKEVSESSAVAWMATVAIGISPAFLTIWSVKSRGGYMALLLLGTVSLLICAQLVKSDSGFGWKLFILGCSLGAAFWSHFGALTYAIPVGLLIVWRFRNRLFQAAWIGGIGFLIGSLPVVIYNLTQSFASLGRPFYRQTNLVEDIGNIVGTGLPILLGGQQPWTRATGYFPGSRALVVGILIAAFCWMVKRQYSERKKPVCLILAFAGLYPLFVIASGAGFFMVEPRYLLPLYSVIYIIIFMSVPQKKWKLGLLVVVVSINLYGSILIKSSEFNTPNYTQPLGPLIEFLQAEDQRFAYAPYWIAYRLTFESQETIICTPPPSDYVRYLPYLKTVQSGEEVVYIELASSKRDGKRMEIEIPEDYSSVRVGDFDVYLPPG